MIVITTISAISRKALLLLQAVCAALLFVKCCDWSSNECFVVQAFVVSSSSSVSIPSATVPFQSTSMSLSFGSNIRIRHSGSQLNMSNFYNDFDNDTDEDDDDDDDEVEMSDEERERIQKFRAQMLSLEGLSGFSSTEDDADDGEMNESSDKPMPTELKDEDSIDALIRFASSTASDNMDNSISDFSTLSNEMKEWATPLTCKVGEEGSLLKKGVVLIANPSKFCTDFGSNDSPPIDNSNPFARAFGAGISNTKQVSPSLLAKFGLTLPPPAEIGADRRADLLPVVLLIDDGSVLTGSQGVLMNRRTGYLIGDLEQQRPPPLNEEGERDEDGNLRMGPSKIQEDTSYLPKLGAFMIQPLWFGGTSSGGESSNSNNGLDMLHMCENLPRSVRLTDDGLFWGGDPVEAQEVMAEYNKQNPSSTLSGFDFKFFVQSTKWLPTQLEKELRDGTWFVASVSKAVLFKSRDRLGTRRGKPLWTEIMELMGDEYKQIRDELYRDE